MSLPARTHGWSHLSRLRGWLIVSLFALAASANAWAIWEKYGPFDPPRSPKRFPHTPLAAHRQPSNPDGFNPDISFRLPSSSLEVLRLTWGDDTRYTLSLPNSGARPPFSTPVQGSPLCAIEAVTADLNRDGVPDYIVVTQSGGNGLAAQITFVTFVLSSPDGYQGREVHSFDARAADLYDLNDDGSPEFVHGMSVWGDIGKDSRAHSYWAYNLIGFSGITLVSANRADRRFPKWIMFSHAANHTETRQLTADQRERQWMSTWEFEARAKEAQACIPFMLTLAPEQRRNARD